MSDDLVDDLVDTTAAATTGAATTTSPYAPGLPLTTDPAWHVARRLAHAATRDLVREIRATGITAWIAQQLDPAGVDDSVCDALVAETFPWLGATATELIALSGDSQALLARHVARATALRQLVSRRVLLESVVELFGDLLYVPFVSDKAMAWVIAFDRDVIRPHAMGTYREMLRAAAIHPGMTCFLDNIDNTVDSVNENLGRELLELHSVGVTDPVTGAPSYTEADVRSSSLLLTGHTRQGGPKRRFYVYDAAAHYVGPLTVMGFHHPNASAAAGPAAVNAYADYLARHPSTARRIATRLCVRFVSDTPPPALVDRLTATYLAHDTAITPVLEQLLLSPQFHAAVGQKIRRPAEYTASAVMAARPVVRIDKDTPQAPRSALSAVTQRLEDSDHYPRGWPVVNGYPDVGAAWTSTAALMARVRCAYDVAAQTDHELRQAAPWPTTLGLAAGVPAAAGATQLVVALTGFTPTPAHRDALAAVLTGPGGTPRTLLTQAQVDTNTTEAVALVLASPYFALR